MLKIFSHLSWLVPCSLACPRPLSGDLWWPGGLGCHRPLQHIRLRRRRSARPPGEICLLSWRRRKWFVVMSRWIHERWALKLATNWDAGPGWTWMRLPRFVASRNWVVELGPESSCITNTQMADSLVGKCRHKLNPDISMMRRNAH